MVFRNCEASVRSLPENDSNLVMNVCFVKGKADGGGALKGPNPNAYLECNNSRYVTGGSPYFFLKHFVKYDGLVNPEEKVVSEML